MDLSVVFAALGDTLNNVAVRIVLVIGLAALSHLIVRTFIGRAVGRAVRGHKFKRRIDEEKREKTLTKVFRTASAVLIWVTVPFVILWQLEVDLTALVTGAGLIGIIVGFGAQSAIKDFLAGIFVLAENQYRVGDIVTLRSGGAELTGLVEDITIRITRLRDLDGNLHIVQNGTVASVTNLSFGFANVNIDVSVSYDSDIDKVEEVMNEVGHELSKDEKWSEHIEKPIQFYRVDGFEDSGVRIKALGEVEPAMQWDVAGEFRRRLKVAFEKHGVVIPYPQIVVHNNNRER
jgi:small conductance mechanosensitive channel